MELEKIQELNQKVKGFLDDSEGKRLFELAQEAVKLGPALEIGSYCGKASLYLGAACKAKNRSLYSIDHHRGSEEHQPGEEYFDPELFNPLTGQVDSFHIFRKTIEAAGLSKHVIPIVCRSDVVARNWATPLSLVFIDGGHSYTAAFTDYNSWVRHIMPGGYLLIHDVFRDSGKGGQAPYHIYKLANASGMFTELPMTGTLGVLKRRHYSDIPADFPGNDS